MRISQKLEKLEPAIKIISHIAIPLIIGIFGWKIQAELSEKSLKKEYVQLAVGILSNPTKSKETEAFREWAIELLKVNSPLPIPEPAIQSLISGTPLNPVVVKVPIPVPVYCGAGIKIEKPKLLLENLPKDANRVEAQKAITIDRLQLLAYSKQLEAILEACREDKPASQMK